MWGSPGWNQWALQPAMFNDVPHEQIDWAELAKQWIQMQQTPPSESVPLAQPPLPPPPSQVVPPVSLPPPPPPPGHVPLISEEFSENNIAPPLLKTPLPHSGVPETFHTESAFENESVPFMPKTTENSSFWNKPEWEANVPNDEERLWAPPPVEPVAPLMAGKETFDYGHVHDNPPLAMQSIDYNHMSEFSYNQVYPTPTPAPAPEVPYDQYWSQVNATPTISPMFLKKERSAANLPVEEEATQIDAAKRKQLPAWIRDGLEKMEQERLKRLERERAAKENAEKMAKIDLLKNNLDFKDGSSIIPAARSKFDSDSEVDENETRENKRNSPKLKRTPSPTEDIRTEEERKEELVFKVRRTLTEVLLSVTNSEMVDIAQEMLRKAISKAPARQLATASSLSSVASGLRGLASYGTESEASDQEEGLSDSEEELYRKIREKKRLFAQKEKKIMAELERKEREENLEAEKEKINNDKINDKMSSKEFHTPEKPERTTENNGEKNDNSTIHMHPLEHSQLESSELPVKAEEVKENNKSNQISIEVSKSVAEITKSGKKEESDSSDSEESSSSDTTSESGEKHKKKSHKNARKSKSDLKKLSRKDKSSSKHSSRRRRSRSSESSEKHRKVRSPERKNNSSKKKKKYKRDSSGSSSSSSHRRKRSSRYESSHSHRERRSRSYDDKERRRKRSVSPYKARSKNDRSSHSFRYSDDKYDRKYKNEKKSSDHRCSPSSSKHSSRLPRKYRTRSLSSESQSPSKKLKKYRNR